MRNIQPHRFSTLIEPPNKTPTSKPFFLPIPHRTIPEPRGQDLDFICVAHRHVINSHWEKLLPLSTSLTPFRLKHLLLALRNDLVSSLKLSNWVLTHNPKFHTLAKHRLFKTTEKFLTQTLSSHPLRIVVVLLPSLQLFLPSRL